MGKIREIAVIKTAALITAAAVCGIFSSCGYNAMEEGFAAPPQEARPRVWWHWEDGNITKDGVKKDLEWMSRIGIGGYHHFDAGLSQAPVVDNRLVYMREEWKDAFRYAIRLSDSLGLTVGIASSPGWSNTGGPWVSRDNAMKKLVWTSVDTEEGQFDDILPAPEKKLDYYRDIAAVALRLPESDGSVRAIKVLGNSGRNMWNILPYKYNLVLEASDDGRVWNEVARVPETTAESITVNFPAVKAKEFRLRDTEGRPAPEYILYTRNRVERSEEKSGFSTPYDLGSFPTVLEDGTKVSSTESVIDLTEKVGADGRLVWDVPEGEWRIIRFGYTLTGRQNGPAPKEATGLEVDKLDRKAYHDYFVEYLDMYREATGGMIGSRGITELLVDSYEAGWQTWTPDMVKEFGRRRGYSLVDWMPALSGEILESAEATEKFLFDWRRTIGELYAESYASVKDIADEYGIGTVCLESQENGRVMVADGMDIKRRADVPMAAIWTEVDFPTAHSTMPIAVADIRESASLSHLYGGRWVGVESMTADGTEGNAFAFTPAKLKRLADSELASGANRFFIHESSHQPLDDCRPGVGLLKYGQWFNRHETWAEQAVAWTDYLARSSYMLSLGSNISDILVYYGEDTNVTARYGAEQFRLPDGYNYDFINATSLKDLKVRKGRIIAPSGASYRVLCLDKEGLPESAEAREALARLIAAGAPVCAVEELGDYILKSVEKDFDGPSELRFVHRKAGRTEFYWVNNPTDSRVGGEVSLRTSGRVPLYWNPENGEISELSYRICDGRTVVELDMNPDDAGFIVFAPGKASRAFRAPEKPVLTTGTVLSGWRLDFPERSLETDELLDYGEFPYEDVKYFSGTSTYTTTFRLDCLPEIAEIDLGEVYDLCEVSVNGKDMGILWRPPFRTDITEALVEGDNTLEVRVVNVWVNRLIGDAQPDCPAPTTYTTVRFYDESSTTLPAGLIGPVILSTK